MSFTKRLSVPVGVAAIVALIVAFGPNLLASAGPRLPDISAKQLIAKTARSHVDGLSGVVEARSQLGLPQLPSGQGSGAHDYGIAPRDLLTGTHTLRVAKAGPEKQRVELLGELAQYTLIHNGRDVWAYDSAEKKAVHWNVPRQVYEQHRRHLTRPDTGRSMTPEALAGRFLDKIGPSTKVDVQGTDRVAGRDVYTLSLAPRSAKSLIDQVQLFVDAETWTPLRVLVTPRGGGDPAIDVGFREVSFGTPPASTFTFTPPEGVEVKHKSVHPPAKGAGEWEQGQAPGEGQRDTRPDGTTDRDGPDVIGKSWTSVLAFDHAPTGKNAGWLARTGTPVSGEFGEGRMITTRLVTALVTDDGHVYVGAVTPQAIKTAAAEAAGS